jgi:hypothetical protein
MPNVRRETQLRVHARRQHGVFTLEQAVASGYSRATVRRRVEAGVWQELAPGAYRVALGAEADWCALTMAMVLSTGGVAYCRSALALFGLLRPPSEVEVVVVRNQRTNSRSPQRSTDSSLSNASKLGHASCGLRDGTAARSCSGYWRSAIPSSGALATSGKQRCSGWFANSG